MATKKKARIPAASSKPGIGLRRKRKWTEKGKRKVALNGRYMGYLNGVPKSKRAAVKKVYREKGVAQAIGLAKKLAA